jgi:DNA modification methylase
VNAHTTEERAGGLAIKWWPPAKVKPYANNPRRCPARAIEKVADSLAQFGWRQPLVVDGEGVLIVGHTRLSAAKRLGLEKVPVHIARDLSPEQAKAYRLADNRTGEETGWDSELLSAEVAELSASAFELGLLGFDPAELAELFGTPTAGLTDPDLVPEPPAEPISRPGDLWLLGNHRLLCGDATSEADVTRVMDGQRAALMATHPPYLVDYQGGTHPATEANGGKRGEDPDKHWDTYIDHEHSVEFYRAYLQTALECALAADGAVYQWFAITRSEVVWAAWRAAGLLPHQVLIWAKSRAVLTHSHYMWNYEPMLYGWPAGHVPARKPPPEAKAIWEIASAIEDGAAGLHPTQKPVETIRRPILYHTAPGGLLYEPFAGSGTAIIAAEMSGRACYALELSPTYVDVAVARWERFSGKQAVRHV